MTSKARYLTSNSGGSWLNAAFSFQDSVPLDSFLGPYLPPQQLSQPTAATARLLEPFPIVMGSIMLPDTPLGFYAIEFSPLYIGSPAFFNETTPPIGGGFVDPIGFNTPPPDPMPNLPSPILQAFAATAANATGFNNGSLRTNSSAPAVNTAAGNSSYTISNKSTASNSSANGTQEQLMQLQPLNVTAQPTYVVPLKSLVGISSSFIINMFQPGGEITRQLTGTESLNYWNQITFEGATLAFADGGSADNLAITPLLRRRVPKIVVCVAASANISAATSPADWAGYQWDISALFGAAPPTHPSYNKNNTVVGIPIDLFNRKLQVFPTQGYDELFYAVRNSTAAGGPSFHMATYDVLTNSFQAIFGGWQVEVLWVVNAQQTKWEQALPQDTAAALAASRESGKKEGGLLGSLLQGVRETISQGGQQLQLSV
ncbi:hypothetical protein OEZ85_011868 [Tetradesmus obliquus]|uniref:Uncharacterized protein n=1 Tax=Tetradesmus obliquus TaxID=3088 RepID=A0ABY8TRL5_TETOB|nr:hypothetical protein OEZ85_011868 [Tetradesmus obliquus]